MLLELTKAPICSKNRRTAFLFESCGLRLSVGETQGSTPWDIISLVVFAHVVILLLLASIGKEASMEKIFFSSILQTVSAFQINIIVGLLLPT